MGGFDTQLNSTTDSYVKLRSIYRDIQEGAKAPRSPPPLTHAARAHLIVHLILLKHGACRAVRASYVHLD